MLKKIDNKVVLVKDKYRVWFAPTPKPLLPTAGVVHPFSPTLKESCAKRERRKQCEK